MQGEKTSFIPFRPDILELSYQGLSNISNGLPLLDPVTEDDLEDSHRLLTARLRFPVFIGDRLFVAGEMSYKEEQVYPWTTSFQNTYSDPLLLRNAGLGMIFQYNLSKTQFLKGYMKHSLKADVLSFEHWPKNSATNVSAVWGRTIASGAKIGTGIFLNQSLGRTRLYPVLVYEKRLSPKAMLDLMFPKELNFKYLLSKRLQFSANYDIESGRYMLAKNKLLRGAEDLEFRRTSLFAKAGLDFCITDILGIFVDVGIEYPFNTVLVARGRPSRENVWDFENKLSPVLSIGLVALAPSKLFSRIK